MLYNVSENRKGKKQKTKKPLWPHKTNITKPDKAAFRNYKALLLFLNILNKRYLIQPISKLKKKNYCNQILSFRI